MSCSWRGEPASILVARRSSGCADLGASLLRQPRRFATVGGLPSGGAPGFPASTVGPATDGDEVRDPWFACEAAWAFVEATFRRGMGDPLARTVADVGCGGPGSSSVAGGIGARASGSSSSPGMRAAARRKVPAFEILDGHLAAVPFPMARRRRDIDLHREPPLRRAAGRPRGAAASGSARRAFISWTWPPRHRCELRPSWRSARA